jgi:outer membrane protein
MKTIISVLITWCFFSIICEVNLYAQNKVWSVDDCIRYALQKNIQIQQAQVGTDISGIDLSYAKAAWYPNLSGSARQNFSWSNPFNTIPGSPVFAGNNGTNISLNSGLTLYNGNKIRNNVKQSEINFEAATYNTEVIKQAVSLSVLNAYLQVLYAGEQVKNATDQVTSLEQQVNLSAERLRLGAIANSDFLQVKSQLATEKQSVATAESQLAINRITLMQLMELSEPASFSIEHPNLDSLANQRLIPDPKEIYQLALGVKPEVKNAELNKKSSQIGIDLAKAGFLPDISLGGSVSTNYSSNSVSGSPFGSQLENNLIPAIAISASVPVFLNRQVRTNVEIARKNTENAELNEYNVKNQLRKAIEQACQDVISSQQNYDASVEAYKAVKESFDVASEKYNQGLMNSVDFLIQKTTFITSESTFLQAKYRLIFSYKVLDFYSGRPLTFKNTR